VACNDYARAAAIGARDGCRFCHLRDSALPPRARRVFQTGSAHARTPICRPAIDARDFIGTSRADFADQRSDCAIPVIRERRDPTFTSRDRALSLRDA